MQVVYEDNHIIIVYKESGEIVQGDKTGDVPLSETVKEYIKEKYHKPGNVFLGVVHRLDRPVAGLVVFARTSKALSRLNEMFRKGEVHKTYWAITQNVPADEAGTLTNWMTRNEKQNKSYAYDREVPGAKKERRYKTSVHWSNTVDKALSDSPSYLTAHRLPSDVILSNVILFCLLAKLIIFFGIYNF